MNPNVYNNIMHNVSSHVLFHQRPARSKCHLVSASLSLPYYKYTYTTHYTHACVCLNCGSLLALVRILLLYVDLCYIQVYNIAKHIYYIRTSLLVR